MKRFYLLSVISLFSAGISAQEITGGERTSAPTASLPRMPAWTVSTKACPK